MPVNKTNENAYDLPFRVNELSKIELLEIKLFGTRNIYIHDNVRVIAYIYKDISYVTDISYT